MSAISPTFASRKRVRRSRDGEASVITDELLLSIATAIKENEDPEALTVLDSHPRATKGSAAGFGHQIRKQLVKAPYNLKVHSSPVPVNEEAYEGLSEKIKAKAGEATTKAEKDALQHYAAFYPYASDES